MERIVAASLDALDEFNDEKIDRRPYARTENLSALCVNMEKLLNGRGKFVLVLDAVDKLREGGGTLIAALVRLGEMVCYALYGSRHDTLTVRTDTKPLPHSHNDPPPHALCPSLVIGLLPPLPIIRT